MSDTNSDTTKDRKEIVVSRDANIADLVFKYPQVADVLLAFGLHCVGCFANAFDTVEQGAKIHGMDEEEIDEIMEEINKVVNNPELLNE